MYISYTVLLPVKTSLLCVHGASQRCQGSWNKGSLAYISYTVPCLCRLWSLMHAWCFSKTLSVLEWKAHWPVSVTPLHLGFWRPQSLRISQIKPHSLVCQFCMVIPQRWRVQEWKLTDLYQLRHYRWLWRQYRSSWLAPSSVMEIWHYGVWEASDGQSVWSLEGLWLALH